MSEIKVPDYKHYSRVNTIYANEAQYFLASMELHEKNISDPDEYNKLLKEELRLAYLTRMKCLRNENVRSSK